ncbi:MAG: type II toxin-antitoxin system VapC family toxin [Dehalococcoidia bacterium]
MEQLVIDANVLVSSFIESETRHLEALAYIVGLERGDFLSHLPSIVLLEVVAAISRRGLRNRLALLARAKKSIADWEQSGKMIVYDLDWERAERAIDAAERFRLRGSDAVIAALAEELDLTLKTFDREILERFHRASV